MTSEATASPEFGQVLKPEEQARKKIDEMLADASWHICDRNHFTSDHNAIALTLVEIFAEIKSRSMALTANVAKLEKLLKGVAE